MDYSNKVCFSLGTGRCGTQFLHSLMKEEPAVASSHERNVFNECFHRYCQWYELPVDDQAFLHQKGLEIQEDLKQAKISFESSAPLALSVPVLYKAFSSKFILVVRSPEKVINSYISKDWYSNDIYLEDAFRAPGYHFNQLNKHHFFSRTMPKGDDFHDWMEMGQVGKLAWFWNTINMKVLSSLKKLPEETYRVVKLEDLDYKKYCDLAEFIGFSPTVTEEFYINKVKSKPNKRTNLPTVADWSDKDINDFKIHTKEAADFFDYNIDIDALKINSKKSVKIEMNKYQEIKVRLRRSLHAAKNAFNQEINQ
jgi:hypothetical protein